MGLLDALRNRVRARLVQATLTASQDMQTVLLAAFGGSGSSDDKLLETVTQAFRNVGHVFRCVSAIQTGCSVGIDTVDADGEPVKSREAERWLAEPAVGMSYAYWLERIVGQLALTGGSRLVRGAEGQSWLPLSLDDCPVREYNPVTLAPISYMARQRSISAADVLEIRHADPTQDYDSTSPAEASIYAWQTSSQAARHLRRTLANGAVIPGAFLSDTVYPDKTKFTEALDLFKAVFSKARSSGSIPFLDGRFRGKFEKLGFNLTDMALPELVRASKDDILAAFGVPPALVSDSESRYANYEQQLIVFYEYVLQPTWRLIESALNRVIGKELGVMFRFKQWDSSVVQDRWRTMATTLTSLTGPVMTVNEARGKLGLPQVTGGNVLWRPFVAEPYEATPIVKPTRQALLLDRAAVSFALALAPAPAIARQSADDEERINGRPKSTRVAYWQAFDGTERRLRRTYAGAAAALLDGIRSDVEKSARENWAMRKPFGYDRDKHQRLARQMRVRAGMAIWRAGLDAGAAQVDAALGQAVRLRMTQAVDILGKAKALIEARAQRWTELTDDETFNAIVGLQQQALAEGWSLQQVLDALKDEFVLSPARAERIARTEVIGSLNGGTVDAYEQSGEVEAKEWLATQDDRTRGNDDKDKFNHLVADGETVPLDAPFGRTGESLDYPGDPAGSPGNIINCRCTVLPVLRPLEGV